MKSNYISPKASVFLPKIVICFFIVLCAASGYGQSKNNVVQPQCVDCGGGGGAIPAPLPFTVSTNSCGAKTLTRSTPPTGITWYWGVGSSPTQSTSNSSATTFSASSSNTYSLMAYRASDHTWGPTTSQTVTVGPSIPAAPTVSISQQCGVTVLTQSGGAYWQGTNSAGTSTSNNATTYSVSTSGTYYIRATNGGCWSSSTAVNVTVLTIPATPPTPTVVNGCGSSSASVSGAPGGTVIWYWQPTAGSTSIGSTGSSYITNSSGTIYLRAVDNGCWSAGWSQATMTVNPVPLLPVVADVTREDAGVVTLNATPGTNGNVVKWYPDTYTGTPPLAQTNSYSPSVSHNTSFYASTYNTSTGCESNRKQVNVNIILVPVITSSTATLGLGGPMRLSTTKAYEQYTWTRNGVQIATTPTIDITQPGDYAVSVYAYGSYATSATRTVAPFNATMNYVIVNQVQKAGVTNTTDASMLYIGDCQRSVTYIGGLGNTLQTISAQASPLQKDLVQPQEYNAQGRQMKQYLPYVSTAQDGQYRSNALNSASYTTSEQYSFYQTGTKTATDQNPFASVTVEPSPLQRVLTQTGPGKDWYDNQKSNQQNYLLNRASDNIVLWGVSGGMPVTLSFYGDYQLQVIINTDENGHRVKKYIDKLGRLVQKSEESSATDWLNTVYVYNDLSQLCFVLQPEGLRTLSGNPSPTFVNDWTFQYHYDALGRVIESRAPGADWMYVVYDPLDRPVLSQDANQRSADQWAFIKYDLLGRAVLSGVKSLPGETRASLQIATDAQAYQYEIVKNSSTGYSINRTYPTVAETDILNVAYYDDYTFITNNSWDAEHHTFSFVPELGNTAYATATTGLPTGGKKRLVNPDGTTGIWLNAVVYYDDHYRPVQILMENHKNGLDRNTVMYNSFTGRVEQMLTVEPTAGVTTLQKYTYDQMNRLKQIWHNINSAPSDQLVVQYEYNELGQLVDKKLHGNGVSFLQSIDYRYTIRGWLRSMNGAQLATNGNTDDEDSDSAPDYFGLDLVYQTTDAALGNVANFNGSISAMKFKGPGYGAGDAGQQANLFQYDRADKLLNTYTKKHGTSAWDKEVNVNNEAFTYDYNGNIKTLSRSQNQRGLLSDATVTSTPQAIDNLTYTYASGNQLSKVDDTVPLATGTGDFKDGTNTATEYVYAASGNLKTDNNKGISVITYNILNLPKQITFTDGRHMEYTYDASGTKTMVKTFNASNVLQTTTEYVGGFVYTNNVLSFFSSPEGRVVKNGSAYEYQYAIADHQGNTRVLFTSATQSVQSKTAHFDGASESGDFNNYPSGGLLSPFHNNTAGGTESLHLTGGYHSTLGIAKSFKVYAGDQLKIDAYALYDAVIGGSGLQGFTTSMLSAFNVAAPAPGETGTLASAIGALGGLVEGGWGDGTHDNADPKAFVTIVLFDKDYNFLDVSFDQVKSNGSFGLISASYTVKEEGHAFMYVSNESPVQTDVYFDDVTMSYTPSNILQYNEYYAHGLQTNRSWTRDNSSNSFLYNDGGELNTMTNMYDLTFRNFDAVLGRFHQVDPMASAYASHSPYNYALNDPINNNDPRGDYVPAQAAETCITCLMMLGGDGNRAGGGGGGYTEAGFMTIDTWKNFVSSLLDPNVNAVMMPTPKFLDFYGIKTESDKVEFGKLISQVRGHWELTTSIDYSEAAPGISAGIDTEERFVIRDGSETQGDQTQEESSFWSDIWNSPLARAIVPDEIGVHLSATLAPVFGVGASKNYFILTRGKDAGFHKSQSVSLRAGEEVGLGISVSQGWYNGAGKDVNLNSLMGWGGDINGELGPANVGVWASVNTDVDNQVTWVGTTVGTGLGEGFSTGPSYTWELK